MTGLKLIIMLATAAIVATPTVAVEKRSCSKMAKELSQLRLEYHLYATAATDGEAADGKPDTEAVSFDQLAEMLDKIIDLKRSMRAQGCKILPRERDVDAALKKKAREEAKSRR